MSRVIEVDDQKYESIEDAPDLGSFSCYKVEARNVRHYAGKSKDLTNFIAKVTYVGSGSDAYVVDTGKCYMFVEGAWELCK